MSARVTTIMIEPPDRIHTEGFVSNGHQCRYCRGRGRFYSDIPNAGTIECPDCGGTGEVMAVVTVEWKPGHK